MTNTKVKKLHGGDRPDLAVLMAAIDNVIREKATDRITLIEIVGVLEMIKQGFISEAIT